MDTGWIERVVRMNRAIVTTEARFNAQVAELVETAGQGEDTAEAEKLLHQQGRKLALLRAIQSRLLQERQDEA